MGSVQKLILLDGDWEMVVAVRFNRHSAYVERFPLNSPQKFCNISENSSG